MKVILGFFLALILVLVSIKTVNAAPFRAFDKNPNVVAYYPEGDHGIPGESFLHQGEDLVMRNCRSCNFQQWFLGTSEEQGGIKEGEHTVWRSVGQATTCPKGWILMISPYPAWGDYLQPGANYCVHNNDFLR